MKSNVQGFKVSDKIRKEYIRRKVDIDPLCNNIARNRLKTCHERVTLQIPKGNIKLQSSKQRNKRGQRLEDTRRRA